VGGVSGFFSIISRGILDAQHWETFRGFTQVWIGNRVGNKEAPHSTAESATHNKSGDCKNLQHTFRAIFHAFFISITQLGLSCQSSKFLYSFFELHFLIS
jgi:hypothetical protein